MLHLAAAVDRPTGYDAASYVDLAQLAEHGGFDFVTLHDTFARPGPDALAVLSGIAPATRRIGLVPTVTTTHTERFQAQAAVAALDRISGGRAGWRLDMSATEDEARLLGSRHPAPLGLARAGGPASRADALGQKAGEVAAAAAALWDSREDEAGPQDVPRGRPADRHTPYPVGFRDAAFFAQGPSTGPRPPQRHPVRVADATDAAAWQTAARYADVVLGCTPRAPHRQPPHEINSGPRPPGSAATPTNCGSSRACSSTSATASTRPNRATAGAVPGRPSGDRCTGAALSTSRN